MQRKLITFIAIALLAVGLAACGSSRKSSSPSGGSSASDDITIGPGLKFTVNKSVKAGAPVTVKNTDSTTHTVISDTSGQFSTGNIDAGKSTTFTAPSTPGSYPFHCAIHGTAMTGTLTVTS